ncbi:NHL repeat protein [Roseimaritima multifibrata]|uniref:NHL repeat protein n=1 Tax=Roseimaritima multifibrata TaxID=1930274 RepID=A0A517MA73_9BACT|nr:hypothetical protein [Roseimaritima multifibrata]QDS91789.1 NHL repeat protein [Roseimaritima multifibrata]
MSISRRQFIHSTAVVAAAGPAILTSKRTAAQQITGSGDHQFHFNHQWAQLPDSFRWQTTHNVAVAPDGLVYIIHEGMASEPDHPSIFVFDAEGKFVRAFGQMFQGGGHGIEARQEGSETFLYVAAYQQAKTIAKLTTKGEIVWQQYAPIQSEHYAEAEAANPQKIWGRDRFLPTNFAFLPDGGFYLADGYGSFYIHRYDADGKWVSSFGGPGKEPGKFQTPHGLWLDERNPESPLLVVCDRASNRLQTFDMDEKHQRTIDGFGLPANADTHGDLLMIPELVARVSLLDGDFNTVATLGEDRQRILTDKEKSKGFAIRSDESRWEEGKFVHPHDACFDADGNIYVAEWVSTGRITKLTRA